jgi:hypothetical protein
MPRRFIEALPRGGGLDSELLREVNRRIAQLATGFDAPLEYVCECGSSLCDRVSIELLQDEIEPIFARSGCYVVAPGHDLPGTEVVEYGSGYLIVRRDFDS